MFDGGGVKKIVQVQRGWVKEIQAYPIVGVKDIALCDSPKSLLLFP